MGSQFTSYQLTSSGDQCLAALARLAQEKRTQGGRGGAWTIISATTLAEGHADWILRSLLLLSQIDVSPLGAALLSASQDDMFRTWESRLEWLKDGFGIAIAGDRPTQDFMTVVSVRNAIVHGNGRLTNMQARSLDQLVQLRKRLAGSLDIKLSATQLILGEDSAVRALAISREFVIHLDKSALSAEPSVMGLRRE